MYKYVIVSKSIITKRLVLHADMYEGYNINEITKQFYLDYPNRKIIKIFPYE